jgi:hypothetical protein
MRNFNLLAILAVMALGFLSLSHCADPLTIAGNGSDPSGPGHTTDTVTVTDTIIQVDTVTVVVTDSQTVCSRMGSNQQEIVWLFRNEEGQYRLEFAALAERDKPSHILSVDVEGQLYKWDLAENTEFILDRYLEQNATVLILTSKPPSFGHSIDVCLTVKTP